jgi:putative toxin-antitoxin system antitoxin component (TIGR02293 family)
MGIIKSHMKHRTPPAPGSIRPESVPTTFPDMPSHDEVMAGFPFAAVNEAAEAYGITPSEMAERIGVSRSTFHRKRKGKAKLSKHESDALARHTTLLNKAALVFGGDRDSARQWMACPQLGLGGAIPVELARTTAGFQEVETLLTRIQYGVYT